jgi:acetylornithine deacetylase/succinyl-diaminopimelate desuccinylase-like protein
MVGLGLPNCQAHAPNETFPLEQLEKGIQFHQEVLKRFAND